MATFVLVHGAWHGGWCWADAAAALRARGHDVHTPTLTGLGERSHLLTPNLKPDDHVDDIVNTLIWRELEDVILVGHSYGGVVITGVAGRAPERLRALVYLDAIVPTVSGEAVFARSAPARMANFQKQIDAGAIGLEVDDAIDTWAADPALRAQILRRITPHPKGAFTEGVTLTGREREVGARHYIVAALNNPSKFVEEYESRRTDPDWTTDAIDAWHDAMLEAPEKLAGRLDAYAVSLNRAG